MKSQELCYIITGIQPWDTYMGSNCKNIAFELSKYHRVVYVNLPLDIATLLRHRNELSVRKHRDYSTKSRDSRFDRINNNLFVYYPKGVLVSGNWISSNFIFRNLVRWNNYVVSEAIREALHVFNISEFVLLNDNDIFRTFYVKEAVKPRCYVYYMRDYLLGVDYWKRHGTKYEALHIAKADLALANSEYLTEYMAKFNMRSFYIGQGCNLDLYNSERTYAEPADLSCIPRPRVGFVGALSSLRIDQDIIRSTSMKLPGFQIVLVGPEDDAFRGSDLHDRKNVHFLGRKDLVEVPAYISHFDVCINPQLINSITKGNYPLKIDEYLAMGKPVVATKTDATRIFGDCIETVMTVDDFYTAVEHAFKTNSKAKSLKRIAMAKSHSWESCVGKITLYVNRFLHEEI